MPEAGWKGWREPRTSQNNEQSKLGLKLYLKNLQTEVDGERKRFLDCFDLDYFFFNFLFRIGVQLINNVVLVSGVQQSGLF